jgi:DNA (cytosine-5)-methyltransferase 1
MLILSIFPGIDLLGRAFEECGCCVVRGPDLLWGGDIKRFTPPAGHFEGIIGGPPCQDFSGLRRSEPTGAGEKMLAEFARCVAQARPEWWLLENVARVPDVRIDGYHSQRLDIDQKWFCDSTRLRHVQFGSRSGRLLHIDRRPRPVTRGELPGCALANDGRSLEELLHLQGLPADFDLPPFLAKEKKRVIGNGVPREMALALAFAIAEAFSSGRKATLQKTIDGGAEPAWVCACGCGRKLPTKHHRYYDFSCRKRAQRKRDKAISRGVAETRNREEEPVT